MFNSLISLASSYVCLLEVHVMMIFSRLDVWVNIWKKRINCILMATNNHLRANSKRKTNLLNFELALSDFGYRSHWICCGLPLAKRTSLKSIDTVYTCWTCCKTIKSCNQNCTATSITQTHETCNIDSNGKNDCDNLPPTPKTNSPWKGNADLGNKLLSWSMSRRYCQANWLPYTGSISRP